MLIKIYRATSSVLLLRRVYCNGDWWAWMWWTCGSWAWIWCPMHREPVGTQEYKSVSMWWTCTFQKEKQKTTATNAFIAFPVKFSKYRIAKKPQSNLKTTTKISTVGRTCCLSPNVAYSTVANISTVLYFRFLQTLNFKDTCLSSNFFSSSKTYIVFCLG